MFSVITNLSRVMRHVNGIYTQRFNRRHRRDGTLFRGRYKAIVIDADEYLAGLLPVSVGECLANRVRQVRPSTAQERLLPVNKIKI
jgi:hypothetical protein